MGIAAYNRGSASISKGIVSGGDVAVNHPKAELLANIPKPFAVGDIVYCRVIGHRGKENTITHVKKDYIKVKGFRPWCPMSNFQREPN